MAQTATDMTQAAADLITAFNVADWEKLRPLVAPDVVYAETGTGSRIEGADAYLDLLKDWTLEIGGQFQFTVDEGVNTGAFPRLTSAGVLLSGSLSRFDG